MFPFPINPILLKYGLPILIVISIMGFGYRTAYNHGKLAAHEACIAETEHLVKQIHERITQVESNLDKLADVATVQQERLSKDIQQILERVKAKPITVIKNGKCVPSQNFVEGLNEAIRRANDK